MKKSQVHAGQRVKFDTPRGIMEGNVVSDTCFDVYFQVKTDEGKNLLLLPEEMTLIEENGE